MSSEIAIAARGLGKSYPIYARPEDRLKQMLWRGRRRFFQEVQAVRDLDLEVRRGETVGIVGRNGSGKSTLLQMIAGTLEPTAGELAVRGRVAALLELGAGFNPEFTGRENVFLSASILGLSRAEIEARFDAVAAFADIGEFIDQPVRSYSSGMFARLAFAVAIHVDPDVLLVDEILAVGDEAFQRRCFGRIGEIREAGGTILLVSHASGLIAQLCDRAVLMEGGERLLTGDPKTVVSRYHRLLYAPAERAEEIRKEIRELDAAGGRLRAVDEEIPPDAPKPLEEEGFQAGLQARGTVEYVPRGARIRDVRIANARGETVNVLRRGETYTYEYRVDFAEAAAGVWFGMMIRNVAGTELGGLASHPIGHGVPLVEGGRSLRFQIPFRARLAPGTYFANAGVKGVIEGEEHFLHRLVDALVFRVAPEADCRITALVDLSTGQSARILDVEDAPAPPAERVEVR